MCLMEADSGFVRNVRSPGSSDLIIKVNGKNVDRYDEEREQIVGEGLFSFDEDMVPEKETVNLNERSAALDLFYDIQSDDLHTSAVELEEDAESEPIRRTNSLAYGTSLPITIPSGRFWPPRNAVDGVEDMDILDFGENRELIDKTVLPQCPPKDLYSEIRAQARSIQAVDDPERLFGERPSRRRYQTGQEWVTSQVTTPLQTFCEDATVTGAVDVEEQTSY
ncbi:LIN1-like protein [Dirofilaria immitis]